MPFPADEYAAMLALKGVGPTVIRRLEQLGYHSLAQLANADSASLCQQIAALLRSSCWQNSPQARASIDAVLDLARRNAPR
ncbi:MAG: recombinase RecA [Vogesella sp.]|uniref:recombinase RecA n=1 Tax=Vogesella sp. TaxID=1904252 RepID=UPI00391ABD1D